ncbi:uncharacterized protein MELLADRAFT_65918 [Melampsora larici-populina 98AG31]|uniref:Uncharacterized protein n=1 Tax=Melampsora larici-populina (strain 98AG31 / pathotype 3-4-7) TaxID=747676 RepID=F4RX83_MELLP|nr:uncharacterized protein MELLADRAFT_65918 [Melampsora larici-populina 98AG31]EGG03033.1 hypothetical protein MELLADRAFT_65918 [Melampsora larici-populina 98AG31]
MDSSFIKPEFKRLPPSAPLPQPVLKGLVGIACPACDNIKKTTPLKYINRLPNAWKVAVSESIFSITLLENQTDPSIFPNCAYSVQHPAAAGTACCAQEWDYGFAVVTGKPTYGLNV